jgi:hypothetical protein
MRELRSDLGHYQPRRIDAEAEKLKGWCEHGQLGVKLYGRRKELLYD